MAGRRNPPKVSDEMLAVVLAGLRRFGRPATAMELVIYLHWEASSSTVRNALAHLVASGAVKQGSRVWYYHARPGVRRKVTQPEYTPADPG